MQVALSLRLVVAKALRRMSRLDEAETHFKVLAGGLAVCVFWGRAVTGCKFLTWRPVAWQWAGQQCKLPPCSTLAALTGLQPAPTSAGWVTEGEAAFGEMSGSAPVSIHQQALRGIALVGLARPCRCRFVRPCKAMLATAALRLWRCRLQAAEPRGARVSPYMPLPPCRRWHWSAATRGPPWRRWGGLQSAV